MKLFRHWNNINDHRRRSDLFNRYKSYMIDNWLSIGFWTFPGCSCTSDKQQRESWGRFPWREPCRNNRTSAPVEERKHVFAFWVNLTIKNQLLQLVGLCWNLKMTLKLKHWGCFVFFKCVRHKPATLYTGAAETSWTELFHCRAARTENEDKRMTFQETRQSFIKKKIYIYIYPLDSHDQRTRKEGGKSTLSTSRTGNPLQEQDTLSDCCATQNLCIFQSQHKQ